MTDQELKALVAGLAVKSDRLDAQIAAQSIATAKAQDRTDAQLAATDAQLAGTDAQLALTNALLATQALAAAKAQDRTDEALAESQRFMKELGRRMGAMASNQGDVAEEFFYNSLREKMELGGVTFDTIFGNFVVGNRKHNSELDILMVNGKSVALIEVKYKAHMNDLNQVEQKISDYHSLRLEHKHLKVYAGLAGFSVPQDVIEEAHQRGLFILQRKGDVIEADTQTMRGF